MATGTTSSTCTPTFRRRSLRARGRRGCCAVPESLRTHLHTSKENNSTMIMPNITVQLRRRTSKGGASHSPSTSGWKELEVLEGHTPSIIADRTHGTIAEPSAPRHERLAPVAAVHAIASPHVGAELIGAVGAGHGSSSRAPGGVAWRLAAALGRLAGCPPIFA